MDLRQVEELIELMRRSGVTELSLELPDYKIQIKRGPEGEQITGSAEARTANPAAQTAAAANKAQAGDTLAVVSPVVGVFHNGGMVEPREMIEEGQRVEKGQLLAAIEAMKVPNEVRAPASGMLARVLVRDGAPVEFGEMLFLIQPEEGGEADAGESLVGLA